jgi:hypothetical protein
MRMIHAVEQLIHNDNVPAKCSVIREVRDCVTWGIIDLCSKPHQDSTYRAR